MGLNWAVIVLLASLTTPAIGVLFGLPGLAGLGFGSFLVAFAFGGLLTGRLMDATGRRVGLQIAFLVGSAGAVLIYLGLSQTSIVIAAIGLFVVGLGTGGANLARTAGADMHPPETRPRGIALVLLGAAFGAVGAPLLFAPLLTGTRAGDPAALALPFAFGAAILASGAVILFAIRVDPREIAERLRAATAPVAVAPAAPRPLAAMIRMPLVPLALLAAIAAQAAMTMIMGLAGLFLVRHGHDAGAVLVTVSVHFLGMFGLVLMVGRAVERLGRFKSVLVGLVVLTLGALLLLPGAELITFIPGMFAVGVGWNIAYVASTSILADVTTPNERGRLLGFSDFTAILGAAALSVLGGLVLDSFGLPGLVGTAVVVSFGPALLFAANRGQLAGAAP